MSEVLIAATVLAMSLAACGSEDPPPTDQRPLGEPATAAAPSGPANLDAFGNLKGSEDIVLGFEMPMGAEKTKRGGVGRYIDTTIKRMERFFSSRGYGVEALARGWQITHTARTLKRYGGADPTALEKATAYVTRGPGPGLSVIFDSGIPKDLAKPALQDLLEAEKQLAAGEGAGAPSPKADEAPAGMVKVDSAGGGKPRAQRPKALDRFELQRLRDAALNRKPKDPKAADVSDRVYKWSKANGGESFQD